LRFGSLRMKGLFLGGAHIDQGFIATKPRGYTSWHANPLAQLAVCCLGDGFWPARAARLADAGFGNDGGAAGD